MSDDKWSQLVELEFESALPDHTPSKIGVGRDPSDGRVKLFLMVGMTRIEISTFGKFGLKVVSVTPETVSREQLAAFFNAAAALLEAEP